MSSVSIDNLLDEMENCLTAIEAQIDLCERNCATITGYQGHMLKVATEMTKEQMGIPTHPALLPDIDLHFPEGDYVAQLLSRTS